MSIVTFWSESDKETAQTMSMAAVATFMAIERNCKILILSTKFDDRTLEGCFWNTENNMKKINSSSTVSLDSGMDGLSRAMASNRGTPEIIRTYTKAVLKDRLDVLVTSSTKIPEDYKRIAQLYPDILQTANQYYDMIFVDINKGLQDEVSKEILNMSNVIVVNLIQNQKLIDSFMELKQNGNEVDKNKLLLLLGRYDRYSKFNIKNVTRYLGERKDVLTAPYNTLYFEACGEGNVVDYFIKLRDLDSTDRNALFINEIKNVTERIVYKIQELQMRS